MTRHHERPDADRCSAGWLGASRKLGFKNSIPDISVFSPRLLSDLIKHKEIPASAKINEADAGEDEGGEVEFEEDSGDDDDDDLDDL